MAGGRFCAGSYPPAPNVWRSALWVHTPGPQGPLQVLPNRLAVEPGVARNRAVAQALLSQIPDHHNLPQSCHLPDLPLASAGVIVDISARLGNFHPPGLGRLRPELTPFIVQSLLMDERHSTRAHQIDSDRARSAWPWHQSGADGSGGPNARGTGEL